MASTPFRLGAYFPHTEIEPDAIAIRDFAQAVEGMGYRYLATADHVIGANRASRPDWWGPYDSESLFHEPIVLFAYLAGLTKLEFVTSIIIAPQRQTVLLARQAANLDIFCQGRLRLGVATGWNQVEYQSLGAPWERRGERLDDQIRVLRRLWTEQNVIEHTEFHTIDDAGIAPLPIQRPIPIWIGGNKAPALRRAARLGDRWMPFLKLDEKARVAEFRDAVAAAGRDPARIGIDNIVHLGSAGLGPVRTVEAVAADVAAWSEAGLDSMCIYTMAAGLQGLDAHVGAFRRVAEMTGIKA